MSSPPRGPKLDVRCSSPCRLVTHSISMPSPNSSLQRTPARGEYIASRRPTAAGNVLATSAYGRTLGPLSSGR